MWYSVWTWAVEIYSDWHMGSREAILTGHGQVMWYSDWILDLSTTFDMVDHAILFQCFQQWHGISRMHVSGSTPTFWITPSVW